MKFDKSRILGPGDWDKINFDVGEYGWESFSKGWVGDSKQEVLENYLMNRAYFSEVELAFDSEEDEYLVHIDGGHWKYFIESLGYEEKEERAKNKLNYKQAKIEAERILLNEDN